MDHAAETLAKSALRNGMYVLRDKYPSLFVGADKDWDRRVNSYWEDLRKHDARTLVAVCKRISGVEYYPDRFPTAGQMARVAREIKRELADTVDATPTKPQFASAGPPHLPDDNVFEQLAVAWEQESQRLGIGPWDTTPSKIARRRLKDLREMWAAHSRVMPMPRAKPDEAPPYQPNVDKANRIAVAEGRALPPPAAPVELDASKTPKLLDTDCPV